MNKVSIALILLVLAAKTEAQTRKNATNRKRRKRLEGRKLVVNLGQAMK